MKRYFLALAAAVVVLLSGCMVIPVEGSGVLVTSRYQLGGFSRVTVSHACRLHVVPDARYSVAVTCDDNVVPALVVERSGPDEIRIGLRKEYSSGASGMTLRGTAASETLSLSGAGPLTLAASGASTLCHRGTPQISIVELSGASRIVRL